MFRTRFYIAAFLWPVFLWPALSPQLCADERVAAPAGTGSDTAFVQPSQSSLTFGNQVVGTSSAAQNVTIANLGDQTTALSISVSTADFSTLNNCPPQLLPAASCTASITFSPTRPGLRTDTLTISSSAGPGAAVALAGSGILSNGTSALTFSATALQFGPQVIGTNSSAQTIALSNSGAVPVVIQAATVGGDFSLAGNCWSGLPYELDPQSSCNLEITFTPTASGTRTGTLSIADSASGSPQTAGLSGTGAASDQNVEFKPSSAISFPDTPVGNSSGNQLIYFFNTGSSPVTVDQVAASGSFSISDTTCQAATVNGVTTDGNGGGYCAVYVDFAPSATGSQSGALTFTDSAPGSPHTVSLTGNGIAATGSISPDPSSLYFGIQVNGTTTLPQYIYLENPGGTPVSITGFSFTGAAAADYSVNYYNCGSLPYSIAAGQAGCYVAVQFTPGAAGRREAALKVASSAGSQLVSVAGSGVAATQAIGLTPTSMNLGPVIAGQKGPFESVYLRNTGTAPVTFSASPNITGNNPAAFAIQGGCGASGSILAAGASCSVQVQFVPNATGAQSANLTFTDSAGTQSVALSGTGVSAAPAVSLSDYILSYDLQLPGSMSPANTSIHLYNNGASPLTLGNVVITGPFVVTQGDNTCNGQSISASGGSCAVTVQFAPASAGYWTGTLTFKGSGLAAVPLAGYAPTPVGIAYIDPLVLSFVGQQVIGTASLSQSVTLYNPGNTAFTVGTITGADFGPAGASAEFSASAANGGSDGCTSQTVAAGSSCSINITFTPNAAGARTGTVSFPVNYANSTTATFTASLSGTGAAEADTFLLSPPNSTFIDQAIGTTSAANLVYLINSGNQPFHVGTLTNTNAPEFSTAPGSGGADTCSGKAVQAGGSCYIFVAFTPNATGAQTGTITFPVTFASHTTASPALALSGSGAAASNTVQISPSGIQFPSELQAATSSAQPVTVTNSGNVAVTIGADSITADSAEFAISSDSCSGAKLNPNAACIVNVTFTPGASSTGTRTGALKIADNATGGPHTVALSGIAIPASQQIVVSQTALSFGNQPAGLASAAQAVYFTNQSDSSVIIDNIALSGTKQADFNINANTCGSHFAARSSCYVAVQFIPPAGASGPLAASISETDASTPGSHSIALTGTAVAPGPAAVFSPSALAFATQNVGTTSAVQYFSVTNTGSAGLTVTAVASTNASEFPVSTDGCSGTTLTPDKQCVIGVKFSPALGGARSGSIQVTDNASGSPQTVALSGTGAGVPAAQLTPPSLGFGNQNLGVTSAAQAITLTNTGTDTLAIGGIALMGTNPGDFAQTNTCPASLAPAAACSINVSFTPAALGTRGANVTITDNANNAAGSTQVVPVTGTGVGVPNAEVAPSSLTFSATDIGVTSAAKTVTITNSGTGPLAVASVTIGGADPHDFAQTNTCGASLAAGANCTISATFTPSAAGTRTATITVTDNANNAAGATQKIAMTGSGKAVPAGAVTPNVVPFSDTNVGVTASAQIVTLSNSGTGALTIASIGFSGANPGDFGQTNTCGSYVMKGGSCAISVTFTPTAPGSRTATLTVTDNANNVAGATQTAALSGTGVAVPIAMVGPGSLTFPGINVGASSASQSITLSNTGTGPLAITSIVMGSTNPGDFSQTNNCGNSVAVNGSCTISVTFTPAAAGARNASLHILDNSNNTGSSQNVTLSGTGLNFPVAGIAPPSLTFANQPLNATSAAQSVTLSNSGTAPLIISNIAFSGVNPGDFAQSNNCAGSVAVASSCTISVTFTPAAVGNATATLNVTGNSNNVAGSVQTVALTGATPAPAVVSLSPDSGSGRTETFVATYSDANGLSDLSSVAFLINTEISFSSACVIHYVPAGNEMYLYNDAGTALSAAVVPGSSSSVSNSQCTLSGAASSFSVSGNRLTLRVGLTFAGTFTGQQTVYLKATGGAADSGWKAKGTWTP